VDHYGITSFVDHSESFLSVVGERTFVSRKMSRLDPCLGTLNSYRGDEVLQSRTPTLYAAADAAAYDSAVARLAAAQLPHSSSRSRLLDCFASLSMTIEETEPWFLVLAAGELPALVRTVLDKEEVACGLSEVLPALEGWAGAPPVEDEEAKSRLLALHADVDVEDLNYALGCAREEAVARLERLASRLDDVAARAANEEAPRSVAERAVLAAAVGPAAARAAALAERLQRWRAAAADETQLVRAALRPVVVLLDFAETALRCALSESVPALRALTLPTPRLASAALRPSAS
jgi:hypothetical protein